jgi:lipopolysaccharide export system protein LptC
MDRVITARTDPQAAHAYWTMSRGDSARAFRSARRHSRMVRILRIAIPGGVVATIIVVSLLTYFNPMRMLARLPINLNDLVVSGTKITMEKPRLSGFTKDERAYEFSAEAAAQDLTKPDIVELRNIHGKIQMEDKSMLEMSADTGTYNTKIETLELKNNINLSSSTGNKGHLSTATVDVRKGNVVSDEPVELEMLQGKLNANRLEIMDSGDVVRFNGGVDMMMMLNNTALPKADSPKSDAAAQ